MPKMSRLGNIPKGNINGFKVESFKGVDLTSGVLAIAANRSPDMINLIPDDDGFPIKRNGFKKVKQYEGTIYGAYCFKNEEMNKTLIHAGTKLYDGENIIYSDMNNKKSVATQYDSKLFISDGKKLLVYLKDGENWLVKTAEELATIPVITIGRKPAGGGQSFNPPNVLTGWVEEHFLSDGTSKAYQLSYKDLLADNLEIKQLNSSGGFDVVGGYTVDRPKGIVNFSTAPAASPITGQDNIKIKYRKTNDATAINACNAQIMYGVDGQPDRLWLTGNIKNKNYCYYSQFRNPLYFGDIWYTVIGSDVAPVTGFSILQNRLIVHKDGEEHGRNAYSVVSGLENDGDATFKIDNVYQGEGAIGCFNSVENEPLFLTRRGVFAMAKSDATNERYSQNRSYYINGELTKSDNISQAVCTIYKKFYVLAVDCKIYLLDSEQKSYEKNSPYSTYQYECYVWTAKQITALWVEDNTLFYGCVNGEIYRLAKGKNADSYNDDATPVNAYWTTPLLNLGSFSRYKTISGVWVICQPYTRSGASVFYASDKEYEKLATKFNIDILDFNDIDFNRFTFNTLDRPSVQFSKKKAKKVKLFQVKIQNNCAEPFGMAALQIEFKTGGKIK